MSAKFTEEDKYNLRIQMIQFGFTLLKEKGLHGVNIDEITRRCYVAKGTF